MFALASNLGNFLRLLIQPKPVWHWTLTTLRKTPILIEAKVTRQSEHVTIQLAEVAVTRNLYVAMHDRFARGANRLS